MKEQRWSSSPDESGVSMKEKDICIVSRKDMEMMKNWRREEKREKEEYEEEQTV
jgi:hypothetical protein